MPKHIWSKIGGEVVVKGKNDKGEKWKVGINKPIENTKTTSDELQALLSLTNCGIANFWKLSQLLH